MGKPWNNKSAEKWWTCGRHVRQKELAPSAKVRRTTPEVVRAPPVWGVAIEIERAIKKNASF
jgi:hypothetical protein